MSHEPRAIDTLIERALDQARQVDGNSMAVRGLVVSVLFSVGPVHSERTRARRHHHRAHA